MKKLLVLALGWSTLPVGAITQQEIQKKYFNVQDVKQLKRVKKEIAQYKTPKGALIFPRDYQRITRRIAMLERQQRAVPPQRVVPVAAPAQRRASQPRQADESLQRAIAASLAEAQQRAAQLVAASALTPKEAAELRELEADIALTPGPRSKEDEQLQQAMAASLADAQRQAEEKKHDAGSGSPVAPPEKLSASTKALIGEIQAKTAQLQNIIDHLSPTNIPPPELLKNLEQQVNRLELRARTIQPQPDALFKAGFALLRKLDTLKTKVFSKREEQLKLQHSPRGPRAAERTPERSLSFEEQRLLDTLINKINAQGQELDNLTGSITPEQIPTDEDMKAMLKKVADVIREARQRFKEVPPNLARAVKDLRKKRAELRKKRTKLSKKTTRALEEVERKRRTEEVPQPVVLSQPVIEIALTEIAKMRGDEGRGLNQAGQEALNAWVRGKNLATLDRAIRVAEQVRDAAHPDDLKESAWKEIVRQLADYTHTAKTRSPMEEPD